MLYPKIAFVNVALVARKTRRRIASRLHADTPDEIRVYARGLVDLVYRVFPVRKNSHPRVTPLAEITAPAVSSFGDLY